MKVPMVMSVAGAAIPEGITTSVQEKPVRTAMLSGTSITRGKGIT
jgi:hypothetical protein